MRFRDAGKAASGPRPTIPETGTAPQRGSATVGLLVTCADRPALFQDRGRPCQAAQGVTVSGALDRQSLEQANLCVGNALSAVAIEVAYGGFAAKAQTAVTLALAGAPAPLTITTAEGRSLAAPHGRPFALDAGDELALAAPPQGTRSYLALRGGFAAPKILGSAATDTLAMIGPRSIREGDVLLADAGPVTAVDPLRPPPQPLPTPADTCVLDVVLGPRDDWFTPGSLALLTEQDWEVTSETSRVGLRLRGAQHLMRKATGELPSEGTPLGAIQVPHSGQPVLFLADHPVTGGYPVIAVVARHHLDLAGQIPIGARIRFRALPGVAQLNENSSS